MGYKIYEQKVIPLPDDPPGPSHLAQLVSTALRPFDLPEPNHSAQPASTFSTPRTAEASRRSTLTVAVSTPSLQAHWSPDDQEDSIGRFASTYVKR